MVGRDVRHDGVAAIVGVDPGPVVDPGSAGPRSLHQRDGIAHGLAEGDAVRMGYHAALHADIELVLLVILEYPAVISP